MASSKDLERRRSSGLDNEEEDNKKHKGSPLSLSSEPVQSINVEWSREGATKKARSKSNEPPARNVRARMNVDLSSSNPEPASFLMGTIANELEVINQMLSSGSPSRSIGAVSSSSPSSPLSIRNHSTASSTQSSPDYYDRLVMEGFEVLDRLREDPFYKKYY